jgi:hypothetical protein
MEEYCILLIKTVVDTPITIKNAINLNHMVDVETSLNV